jgi:hypothetical protein
MSKFNIPTTSHCASLGYSFPKRVRDKLFKRRTNHLPLALLGYSSFKRRRIWASGNLLAVTQKPRELSISPPYKGGVLPVYREGGGWDFFLFLFQEVGLLLC